MRIECLGNIGIVDTKLKKYRHIKRGFWRKGRYKDTYIKAKKIWKFKKVKLKEPYLSGNIELKVYEDFCLGGIYKDETGRTYVCTSKTNFTEQVSTLKVANLNLGKLFSAPQSLHLVAQSVGE